MPAIPSTEPINTRGSERTPKNSRALRIFIQTIVENAIAVSADVMCSCAR